MESKQKKQMDLLTAIEQIVEKASIVKPRDILNMCQTNSI